MKCPTCRTAFPDGTQFEDQAAEWKEHALKETMRADRLQSLLFKLHGEIAQALVLGNDGETDG